MGSMDLTYPGMRPGQEEYGSPSDLRAEEENTQLPNESYQVDLTHYNDS